MNVSVLLKNIPPIQAIYHTKTYFLFNNRLKDILTHEITFDQKGITEMEKIFIDYSPQLLRLYKQIYPHNLTIQQLEEPTLTPQIIEKEQHVISIMMQNIESILYPLTQKLMPIEPSKYQSWVKTFKLWFTSSLVREFWHNNKQLYNQETQNFVKNYILEQ